ncbi:MAG: SH3 domain-containing protein [Kofleriaceae bacterium]
MRALLGFVIAACTTPVAAPPPRAPTSPVAPAQARDLPLRAPVDPIAPLAPADRDPVSWLVPGRIQLEPGGAPIEGPTGNRPLEVGVIDERGRLVRVAIRLDHARFSVWTEQSHLLAVVTQLQLVRPVPGGGGGPSEMTVTLRPGVKVQRLARKTTWTQVRFIGPLSLEGWIPEASLGQQWPRDQLRRGGRMASPRKTLMLSPGAVIRTEPKWTGRQLAVMSTGYFVETVAERGDGWFEVIYRDGELEVHGFVSKRDPPGRAHRFTDPDVPLPKITANVKLPSGTCLHARAGGDPVGYLVGDVAVELAQGSKLGWWDVAIDTPWGPITFAAGGPDVQSLASCAPPGTVPPPVPPRGLSSGVPPTVP